MDTNTRCVARINSAGVAVVAVLGNVATDSTAAGVNGARITIVAHLLTPVFALALRAGPLDLVTPILAAGASTHGSAVKRSEIWYGNTDDTGLAISQVMGANTNCGIAIVYGASAIVIATTIGIATARGGVAADSVAQVGVAFSGRNGSTAIGFILGLTTATSLGVAAPTKALVRITSTTGDCCVGALTGGG